MSRLRHPGVVWLVALSAAFAGTRTNGTANVLRAGREAHMSKQALGELSRGLRAASTGQYDAAVLFIGRALAGRSGPRAVSAEYDEVRAAAVLEHLRRGHALEHSDVVAAAVEFRSVLALDPGNEDALSSLRQLATPPVGGPGHTRDPTEIRVERAAAPVELAPDPGVKQIHFRGVSRDLLALVASTYGLKAYVENELPSVPVRFDIEQARFADTMRALRDVIGVDWIAIEPRTIYFGLPQHLESVRAMATRTFYVQQSTTAQTLTEMQQAVRSVLDLTHIQVNAAARSITVRDTPEKVDAAEKLLLSLDHPRGDVILDVRIMEVNQTLARDLGIDWPTQFQLFAVTPILRQLGLTPDLQQLQQLLQNGTTNFSQLGNLGGLAGYGANPLGPLAPLLNTPFALFGGGATLMAVTIPPLSVHLSANQSYARTLERALLRSSGGQPATLTIGERYPLVSSSFAAPFASTVTSGRSTSLVPSQPFSTFTYEDLGLQMKITPRIMAPHEVGVEIETRVRALAGGFVLQQPIISNRELHSYLQLHEGNPAIVAGLFTRTESQSFTGIPGLSQVPALRNIFGSQTSENDHNQLVIIITPLVVQSREEENAEIWLPPQFSASAGGGFIPSGFEREPFERGPEFIPVTPEEPPQPQAPPPREPENPGAAVPEGPPQ